MPESHATASALAESALKVRLSNAARRDDPLTHWHFAVPRLRDAFAMFSVDGIDEMLIRSCNAGGKTTVLAAFIVSCAQKRQTLDGAPLPQWLGPVECGVFSRDYKRQLMSVQPAFLRVLGNWPHHARYTGEILTSLRVKPINGSDDEAEWSVIHFFSQENRGSGTGFRLDVAGFDEPPLIEILREMRKAAHANRRFVCVIAATPTKRTEWLPIKHDYGDCPRRTLRRVDKWRAEVRFSLDEVEEFVLSADHKDMLRAKYASDPLRDAREHGDYIDTSGMCPFDVAVLERMLDECTEPQVYRWRIRQKVTEGGQRVEKEYFVPVQVWQKPKYGRTYYIPIDPASGVEGGHPLGLHVVEWGSGDLVARYLGHDSPYVVGVLAAGLARQYNNALVQPEINDGWATGVFRGLDDNRYGNVGKEPVELKPGEWHDELGFRTTHKTRPGMISAVQHWVTSWGAGNKYALCPSREVIENLMDVILDENDKPVVIPGLHHGEDMILRGQGIRKVVSLRGMDIPDANPPIRTPDQELMAMIRGETQDDNHYSDDGGEILYVPRPPV